VTGPHDALQDWAEVAAAWERHADTIRRHSAPVTEWLVARLDPKRGQTILELAAGPGDTGFVVARQLGAEGRLISSDFAPEMVEVARRRATGFGLENVEFRTLVAQAIDLPDDLVDGVVCRFGFMLLHDPDAALSECRRVIRSGGRLVSATWGPPERNPWIMSLGIALLQHGYPPPGDPFGPGGIFSMADPERVRKMLMNAGFAEVDIVEVQISHRFSTFDEYWNLQSEVAGPLAVMITSLSPEERSSVKDTVRESVGTFTEAGELALPGVAVVASAN
jgi:SAM-dependent methyltransferase